MKLITQAADVQLFFVLLQVFIYTQLLYSFTHLLNSQV